MARILVRIKFQVNIFLHRYQRIVEKLCKILMVHTEQSFVVPNSLAFFLCKESSF